MIVMGIGSGVPNMRWWGRTWFDEELYSRVVQIRLPWWTVLNGNQQAQAVLRYSNNRFRFHWYIWRFIDVPA